MEAMDIKQVNEYITKTKGLMERISTRCVDEMELVLLGNQLAMLTALRDMLKDREAAPRGLVWVSRDELGDFLKWQEENNELEADIKAQEDNDGV